MEYKVVFEGRLVDGFVHDEVRKAFSERFGEHVAVAVFSKSSAVLKEHLTKEQADQIAAKLAAIGMRVTIEEVIPFNSGMVLSEEAAGRDMPSSRRAAANDADGSAGEGDANPVNETYSLRDMEDAFEEEVILPDASQVYLWRLLPVAAVMLLLPLVYVGIALLSVRVLLWVAFGGRQWFFGAVSPGYATITIYAAVLLATLLFTAFICKPLLAKPYKPSQPVRVDPDREPVLYSLVADITEAIGAQMPDEILVDTEVNASARLTKGPFSNELTLTIGLPLIWGADVRTVTGILAHEFGHFTQRWGMRAQYAVHWVNYWFHRQIHERDRWDVFVDRMLQQEIAVLTFAGGLAQLGSAACRWILHWLSVAASIISFSFSRQMEFDADRYEIALVGSKQYAHSAVCLRVLASAYQDALGDLDLALDSNKKVDNLPRMVALRAERYSDEERERIAASIEDVNTSVFDTHPTDRERIDRAEDAEMEPCFNFDGPASGLVRELERLSKSATLQWYRSMGFETTPDELIPLDEFESESENLRRAESANQAFFGELVDFPIHLKLPKKDVVEKVSMDKLEPGLDMLEDKLRMASSGIAGKRDRLYLQREYRYYYSQARFWLKADFPIDPDGFRLKLTATDPGGVDAAIREHTQNQLALEQELTGAAELLGKRLGVALELARRSHPELEAEIELLRDAYRTLARTANGEQELVESHNRLELLLPFCAEFPDNAEYRKKLAVELKNSAGIQDRIRETMATARDPFRPEITLNFALPDAPPAGSPEPVEVFENAGRMLRQLARISFRLRGRMAEIALEGRRPPASG